MGNASLRDIAKIEDSKLSYLDGEEVVVDGPNWLYKYLTTTTQWTETQTYTTPEGNRVPNLIGILTALPKFYNNNTSPLFIFDGGYHSRKESELSERKEKRGKAEEKAREARDSGDDIRASVYESRSQRLTDIIMDTTFELLDILDVPYMVSPQAAESQASHITRNSGIDYVISEDYDCLLFGATNTIRKFTSSGDEIELMNFNATLENRSLTHLQLVDIALLCGTDYNEGVAGIGPKRAVEGVKKHGSIEGVLEENNAEIDDLDALRNIFRNPEISEEWPNITSPSPDIDRAREYIVEDWHVDEDLVEDKLESIDDCFSSSSIDDWM